MKKLLVTLLSLLISFTLVGCNAKQENTTEERLLDGDSIKGQELIDFEFLKLENDKENKVYSPLSIKTALKMLYDGANGETKEQLAKYVKDYTPRKINNDNNKSIANGLFIKDDFKDTINNEYVDSVVNKYSADVIIDSFKSADVLNNWISKNTYGLIDKLTDDISKENFILANTVAIDMEWNNLIKDSFSYYPAHENASVYVESAELDGYVMHNFNGFGLTSGLDFASAANKYDIIGDLGKDNIINMISNEYEKWYKDHEEGIEIAEESDSSIKYEKDSKVFAENFVAELDQNYGYYNESTDFGYYADDNCKIFQKELQAYDDIKLEYISIMPINDDLDIYINNINQNIIDDLTDKIMRSSYANAEEGYLTIVEGIVPIFDFSSELDFIKDLQQLNITNVFDERKADLSNIANGAVIDGAIHKADIKFSNEGIKAAAASSFTGLGAGGWPSFEHLFDIPTIEIDLTFNKPFIFIIRDADTKENWFIGKVYKPSEYQEPIEW